MQCQWGRADPWGAKQHRWMQSSDQSASPRSRRALARAVCHDEDRNVVWVQIIRYTLPLGVLAEYTEVETFTAVVKDEEPQP